ncbi:MAG: S8 family serine peptidase, partial [Bacteroidetes bacterium]|nr:S8 family serine peptidase [Bacteroidota bacterium]
MRNYYFSLQFKVRNFFLLLLLFFFSANLKVNAQLTTSKQAPSVLPNKGLTQQQIQQKSMKLQKTAILQNDDNPAVIYLNSLHLDASDPALKNVNNAMSAFNGKQMHLVKFGGAIQPEWYKLLTDAGVKIVDYIPNYAYMVYGDYNTISNIRAEAAKANSPIIWDGAYLPEYKIAQGIYSTDESGNVNRSSVSFSKFSIQLFDDAETNAPTFALLKNLKTLGTTVYEQRISHYINLVVSLSAEGLRLISERPDVISIQGYLDPKMRDESQNMIMTGQLSGNAPSPGNYLTWLASKGFTQAQFDASGFVVNLSDDGLDNGSVANVLNPTYHFALFKNGDPTQATRVAFSHKQGTATDVDTKGCGGHGNLNTHIVGGYVPDALLSNPTHTDANGFRYGLGVAPFVKVGNSTIFKAAGTYTNPNFANLEAESYRDGGRISSNSWGANVGGAYTADAQAYDFLVRDAQPAGSSVPTAGNQEMVIVFSAGNAGSGAGTIGSPGTGKNVLTVGATEGVRAFGGNDGCGINDAGANSANDMISFSSRGPCTDGRTKPDIVAPGTHITGGVYPSAASNPIAGAGTANACFTGASVCGGVGSIFFPSAGQQWYTASSGTSHSTPAVAGIAALIRQDFINRSLTPPSPAMTKAMVLLSGSYMNGTGAGGNLFSNNQGMGRVDMSNYFNVMTGSKIIQDQVPADMFTASGQSRTVTGVVANTGLPVRIVLAYTDAPGPTSGNAYVNNLDLEVTVNGTLYKGNVFTGANSVTGGTADAKNNVESVFLPAGTSGSVVVTVKATNIAGDGVPNTGGALDQDFALVIGNVTQSAAASIVAAGSAITAETCVPNNGVIDPSEQVTVNFTLQNNGTAATTNLVATLQATGGVVPVTTSQTYGALAASGGSATKAFTFNNTGLTCGSTLVVTLALQDGANNLGTAVYTYTLGTNTVLVSQNFDAVTAPALPSGWSATGSGGGVMWQTNTTTPYSAPNAAFTDNPNSPSDKQLVTSSFTPGNGASVSFRNNYNTENGFDGAVLEISINGGAFVDITSLAGGAFTAGGYNGTISSSFGNPLGGRQAWTGNSGGYVLTSATLPTSAAGQPCNLRFRFASDNSVGATGWRVDDFSISQYACCPGGPPPSCTIVCPANITVNAAAGMCGANVTLPTPTTTGACGTVTLTPASGSFFPVGTTTVTATTGAGPSCTFTVTVLDVEPPVITCPASITKNNDPNICGAVVTYSLPIATDNCAAGTPVTYTQSTNNNTITPGVAIACPSGDNHFWRAYNLSLSSPLTIKSVRFGVEQNATAQTVTVRLYTSAGAFPGGTRTLVGTTTVPITTASGVFYTANFATPPTVAANAIVAVEVEVPTGNMWPGANTLGESAPSYISSATCGVPAPVTLGSLGFTAHYIIDIGGTVPGTIAVTQIAGLPSGATFPVGTTTNTYKATDGAGNSSTCSFTVTVKDVQAPVITCPGNITATTPAGSCTAVVNYAVTATDNCPGVTTSLVSGLASG